MKKLMFKIEIKDEKSKKKMLQTAAGFQGVESVAVDLKEKKMTVIGDTDPVSLTSKLRKNGFVELLSVGPAREVKVGSAKEKKKRSRKVTARQRSQGKFHRLLLNVTLPVITIPLLAVYLEQVCR